MLRSFDESFYLVGSMQQGTTRRHSELERLHTDCSYMLRLSIVSNRLLSSRLREL